MDVKKDIDTSGPYKPVIALINANDTVDALFSGDYFRRYELIRFDNGVELFAGWEKIRPEITAIISNSEIMAPSGISLLQALSEKPFPKVPFFIITNHVNDNLFRIALRAGVCDIFSTTVPRSAFESRIHFLVNNWEAVKNHSHGTMPEIYKTPFPKRAFDIVLSLSALLVLSPLFGLIMLALKVESAGPAFYYSFRVGTGYRIFKLFKFRSMYVNAEEQFKSLKHLNKYDRRNSASAVPQHETDALCSECTALGIICRLPLYADHNTWCEKQYRVSRKTAGAAAFFKLKNDPRVSQLGRLLRKTSMDELPQLLNVLRGEMSIVGNRPLPLYEAEQLTTDKHALRFMAPAGMTGLWQVKNRSKKEMEEEERMMLDNSYAKDHGFFKDIRLIVMTIPALFQHDNS